MLDLVKLKIYLKPYYQKAEDETLLEQYLEMFKTPESAAAQLWTMMPGEISAKNVRVYTTAASSTTFHSFQSVVAYCHAMAKHFSELHDSKVGAGSMFINVEKDIGAGGVKE